MDIILYKKAASFLTKLYSDRKSLISETRTVTKTSSPAHLPIQEPFERATPEEVGIESATLLSFLEEYAKMTELHPHLLMIMKDEKIILETDFYPYHRDTWHVSHSLCKSITALAVGLMIEDGVLSLDEKLTDIFPKRAFNFDLGRQKELTIRTLLNMTSAVSFNEFGSAVSDDWVNSYFSSDIKQQPGAKFGYNSMNTYMLSACIREKTGRDMFDILNERIFHPMGITEIFWEKCPKGITKGGWGLYMKIEDLMKFASLFLSGGIWKGKRLISEHWLREMTKKQIATPESANQYGYGYQVWQSSRSHSYQFNGMLGQNLIIFPDIHMAIATYSGSAEFFPTCTLMALIDRHFGNRFHPAEQPLKPIRRMQTALERFNTALALPPVKSRAAQKEQLAAFASLVGASFPIDAENLGLLPVMISILHGNFSDGIDKIAFEARENRMEAVFVKKKEIIRVPFTADGNACYFDFIENGEHFYAATVAKMTKNEEDIPVFKLSIYFLETTSVRHIKFFFHHNKTVIRFSEDPTGEDMLESFAPIIEDAVNKNKTTQKFLSRFDFGIVEYNIDRLFSPEFVIKS